MHGFQLWANLPSSLKMTEPRYQDVKAGDVPLVVDDDGTEVRVVCGSYHGTRGPVDDVAAKPVYLDVSIPAGRRKVLPVETTSQAFAYVFAGGGKFCNASKPLAVPSEPAGWADTSRRRTPTTVRSSFSTGATTWKSRPATTGSGSCSSPDSRSASPWPGTAPLS